MNLLFYFQATKTQTKTKPNQTNPNIGDPNQLTEILIISKQSSHFWKWFCLKTAGKKSIFSFVTNVWEVEGIQIHVCCIFQSIPEICPRFCCIQLLSPSPNQNTPKNIERVKKGKTSGWKALLCDLWLFLQVSSGWQTAVPFSKGPSMPVSSTYMLFCFEISFGTIYLVFVWSYCDANVTKW